MTIYVAKADGDPATPPQVVDHQEFITARDRRGRLVSRFDVPAQGKMLLAVELVAEPDPDHAIAYLVRCYRLRAGERRDVTGRQLVELSTGAAAALIAAGEDFPVEVHHPLDADPDLQAFRVSVQNLGPAPLRFVTRVVKAVPL